MVNKTHCGDCELRSSEISGLDLFILVVLLKIYNLVLYFIVTLHVARIFVWHR